MSEAPSGRVIGIAQVTVSGLMFGLLGWIGKTMLARGVEPGEFLALRYLGAALVMWVVLGVRAPASLRLGWRDVGRCAFLGVCAYALFSSLYFASLRGLSASLAVLLLYTYPVIVAGAGWVLWGQAIPAGKRVAIPLAMAGMVMLVWGELSIERAWALGLAIGSAVFYSMYILASSRLIAGLSPWVSLTYILSFSGLALGVMHFRDANRALGVVLGNWDVFAIAIVVSTIGAMGLFLAGLRRLRPWEASLLSLLEPTSAVVIAALFLGERLSSVQACGGLAVLGAMVVVSWPKRAPQKVSGPDS